MTAAIVGMGSEIKSEMRDRSFRDMSWKFDWMDLAHSISYPLEKNLPSAVVIRAVDEVIGSDLIRSRVDRIASINVGFSRCSPGPVIVRM